MNCCRKNKRPKREEPLELVVSLAQQNESPLAESATPDEDDLGRQQMKLDLLKKIEFMMEKNIEPLMASTHFRQNLREFYSLGENIEKMERILDDSSEDFEENLLRMINDGSFEDTENKITPEYLERILKKKFEKALLNTMKDGNFEEIEFIITPRALVNCESSCLLMGMKVSFELRKLADKKGADEEKFNQLATTVEAFINSLLDPLRSDKKLCEEFGEQVLDHIIDDAIDLDQMKFLTHPAIEDEMNRKFHGRDAGTSGWNWWQLLLFRFFCFFDLLFCPILFVVFSLLEKRRKRRKERRRKQVEINEEANQEEMSHVTVEKVCRMYTTPYAKYVRDTLSYIVLVVLHYALCLSPSTIAFSRLEWVILIFFVGRYLVERQQIWDIMQRIKKQKTNGDVGVQSTWIRLKTLLIYVSDPWNLLDSIILVVYLIILTLRVTTWLTSGSEMNNRALAIAGYLYSFNSLCLTLRAFGYVMEQSRHLGVIQIALFNILKDISTVLLQFIAGILAFSIAITKVYMAEQSFIANGNVRNDITCRNSGLSCWWSMVIHLGWSLLGVSEESDPMASVDLPSETIARILYAAFLIFGVILLLNMLIALLCNTYQRIEDNSLKVWSMKRAITIQTYDAFDPVPVPLNILYSIGKLFRRFVEREDKKEGSKMDDVHFFLGRFVRQYVEKHGNLFPVTDEDKIERVLFEQKKSEEDHQQRFEQMELMISQVLCTTFTPQGCQQGALCGGPEMWNVNPDIRIEGPLLLHGDEGILYPEPYAGARYLKHLSAEFPHFEVVILETGKQRLLGIGVVNEDYGISKMPGWGTGSVGYHTDDGGIFCNSIKSETKGSVMARRGDRIRCTVMFNYKVVYDGKVKVPVVFYRNGRKIITKEGTDMFGIDYDKPLYPYVTMTRGVSVLAKMCSRTSRTSREVCKIEDLDCKFSKGLEETKRKLCTLLSSMTDVKEQHDVSRLEELDMEVQQILEGTNQKLDALLTRLSGSK